MSEEPLAYVCSHVFANSRPILLVSRAGGDWQFLCGGQHEASEVPRIVGRNHLIDRDATLMQIHDLALGWDAERVDVSAPWQRWEHEG